MTTLSPTPTLPDSSLADLSLRGPSLPSPSLPGPGIPDPRPAAVRWQHASRSGNPMTPLPLEHSAWRPALDPDPLDLAEVEACQARARSLLGALVDALQGRRSLAQLTRWVSADVMADLVLRARTQQRTPTPLTVRSVRVQVQDRLVDAAGRPRQIVELSARLQSGDRFTAVALRLERIGSRWFCPVVDFGPPPNGEAQVRPAQRRE